MGAAGIALTTAGIVGGTVGAKAAYDAVQTNKCSSEEEAVNNAATTFSNSINTFSSCANTARTNAQLDACYNQYANAFQQFLNVVSQYCSCTGSSATGQVSAADKAAVRETFNQLRSLGFNIGSIPSCYQ